MESEARILLVEDEREHSGPVRDRLKSLEQTPLGLLVKTAKVDVAEDAETATRLLRQAAAQLCPYDIVLLDLKLPWKKRMRRDVERGFNLLSREIPEPDRGSVLISTEFGGDRNVQHALKLGAYSFVLKPHDHDEGSFDELFRMLAFAYRNVIMRRANAWLAFKEQHREQWTIMQRERQVIDRFSRIVTDGMSTVLFKTNQLADLLGRDYEVDFDTERHPIGDLLRDVRNAASATASSCSASRSTRSVPEAQKQKVSVHDVIEEVIADLRPGFVYRHVRIQKPTSNGLPLLFTFVEELKAVLREIIFNAIEKSSAGDTIQIKVNELRKGRWTEVVITAPNRRSSAHPTKPAAVDEVLPRQASAVDLARMLAGNFGGGVSETADKRGVKVVLQIPDLKAAHENGSAGR